MNFQKMKSPLANKRLMTILSVMVAAVAITISGLFIYETTKKSVVLNIDGEVQEVRTHAKTVSEILKELNISYRSQDYLSPDANTEIDDQMEITFKTAQQVTLSIDGNSQRIWTTTDTVSEFLKEQNVSLKDQDILNVALDEPIKDGLDIQIAVAFKLVINDGGKETEYWSTSTTVADFLEQQGITINELDKVEPGLDQELASESTVTITRVEKVIDVVEEEINFAVVTKKDDNLQKGKEKVVQEGKKGKIQKKYEVVMENGVVVSKTLIGEEVIEEAKDKIIAQGTKVVQTVFRGERVNDEFYVTATAYTPYCNGCNGYTATGVNIKDNPNLKIIAVDPKVIPLGTKVYVDGYGYAVAADTGGSIKGYKIDVLFPTKAEAYKWGVRKVKIKILK